ncbi:uncharacterized protein LOC114264833 [Camellia sinensis]|uniref:uncharacterized protein LOC114264833 n=1 Tax=Camellia sinensis TaxID=4442 RepID=UPI0010368D32|nr:uncharacterized protein LOC114264833 [Camellia sinensis]
MPVIISEVQTTFLEGRFILDGVLIANEVVHWWKAEKMKGIILKLDFEKAYDLVNCEFLLSMMKNFGFWVKWVSWIKTCLSSSKVFVLVNGSPIAEFIPQRGLRHDDTIIFYEAERGKLVNIKRILSCFEVLSGLKALSAAEPEID